MDYNAAMDATHDATANATPASHAEGCTPETASLAAAWQTRILALSAGMPAEAPLPDRWIDAVALLVGQLLLAGHTVELVVPDDETLPELSSTLDIDLRPLCLVLPEAEFASRIAMRATLTLLRSRLSRQLDHNPAWQNQHSRVAIMNSVWQSALMWGQSESSAAWPDEIGHLFPARLLPASHAEKLSVPADIHILIAPERMPGDVRDALASRAQRLLCLSAWRRGIEHRQLIPFDESVRQRFELDMLAREIAELELELATAQQEVASFSQRYYAVVGSLMVTLDQMQAELANLKAAATPADPVMQTEAHERAAQADHSAKEHARFESMPKQPTAAAFSPSRDLRKLYRQIAQKIHPDRAESEVERQWRTELMAEATRAYRSEDTSALEAVLARWQGGPAAASAIVADSQTTLARQVEQMRQRLGQIQSELDKLLGSRLYELLVANRLASRQGRDLLQEIAGQIEAQIAATEATIDTIKAQPAGEASCNAAS